MAGASWVDFEQKKWRPDPPAGEGSPGPARPGATGQGRETALGAQGCLMAKRGVNLRMSGRGSWFPGARGRAQRKIEKGGRRDTAPRTPGPTPAWGGCCCVLRGTPDTSPEGARHSGPLTAGCSQRELFFFFFLPQKEPQ